MHIFTLSSRSTIVWAVLVWLGAGAGGKCDQESNVMTDTDAEFYTMELMDDPRFIERERSADAIRDEGFPIPVDTRPKTADEWECVRPFVNDALNSRVAASLPDGVWTLAWRAELNPTSPSVSVMHAAERTVVQSKLDWLMFDNDGKPIGRGPLGASHVRLDPAGSTLFAVEFDGALLGWRLSDGQKEYSIHLPLAAQFARPFVAVRGRHLVAVGVEQNTEAHEDNPPTQSMVQTLDLGDPREVTDNRIASLTGVAEVMRDSTILIAAMQGDTLTLASTNRIYLMSVKLGIKSILSGTFEPLTFSLDAAGRIYLIADVNGKRELWLVNPDGKRAYAVRVPRGLDELIAPPIVGYDHRAYLLTHERVGVIEADGTLAWVRPALKKFGGATITADDKLLASDGGDVVYFGPTGQRVAVINLDLDEEADDEESLSTPPILTKSGRLMVASGTHLYCFEPAAK